MSLLGVLSVLLGGEKFDVFDVEQVVTQECSLFPIVFSVFIIVCWWRNLRGGELVCSFVGVSESYRGYRCGSYTLTLGRLPTAKGFRLHSWFAGE